MPEKHDTSTSQSDTPAAPPTKLTASYGAPLGPWAGYTLLRCWCNATTSPHQHIEIVDLPAFGELGRAYRLDGRFMASLAARPHRHECMVHPLLACARQRATRVDLGGGDGGLAREALRHVSRCGK